VKYQWPELARVKLDISPDIHVSGKLRSSRRLTAWLSALTEITAACGALLSGVRVVFIVQERETVHKMARRSCLCHTSDFKASIFSKYLILKGKHACFINVHFIKILMDQALCGYGRRLRTKLSTKSVRNFLVAKRLFCGQEHTC
jgi:hypothetical protein